jgi:hypothetical protein
MAMETFYPEEMQWGCLVFVLHFFQCNTCSIVFIQRVLAEFDIAQVPLNICKAKNAEKCGKHPVSNLQVNRRELHLTSFISTISNFCN